jgi:hypothetical protein
MKRVMILLMAGAVVSGVAAYMAAARTVPGTLGREPARIAAGPEASGGRTAASAR